MARRRKKRDALIWLGVGVIAIVGVIALAKHANLFAQVHMQVGSQVQSESSTITYYDRNGKEKVMTVGSGN